MSTQLAKKVEINSNPYHGKQKPQVLIVGRVSKNLSGAYETLLKLESEGEVEIVYRELEDSVVQGKDWSITIVNEISGHYREVFIDSLSMITDNTSTAKVHKHPHWHKGRW